MRGGQDQRAAIAGTKGEVVNTVTALRPKDPTAAERQRRSRARRRQPTVTPARDTSTHSRDTIGTVQMAALAGRLSRGDVTPDDLELAGRLILMLVQRLPEGAVLDVGC
jgi:hypothetical protein